MAICDRCGVEFDVDEAETDFVIEYYDLAYANLNGCFCGDCAKKIIEDEEDGMYFEECEDCGMKFDLFEEEMLYPDLVGWMRRFSVSMT